MEKSKVQIRSEIKEILKENKQSIPLWNGYLCDVIKTSDLYFHSKVILGYSPLPDEVDITPVLNDAISKGKEVYLPKIKPGTSFMEFFKYTGENSVEEGSFGIKEPSSSEEKPLSFKEMTNALVLVPGRAFTPDGDRLGRGKGFYDIYFQERPEDVVLAGVCFPCQVVSEIPATSNDIKMDFLY